jgi:type IV fimbrial biogenesis protein FimU
MNFGSGFTRAVPRRSWQRRQVKNEGFTLIELLVTVVIVGIFAAMALPGFGYMLHKNSVTAAANELYDLLQYSRAEAVTRGNTIIIRAANGANTGWNSDVTVAISVNGTNTNLRRLGATGLQAGIAVAASVGSLTFSPTGTTLVSTCFTISHSTDTNVPRQYISVLSSGRVTAPTSVNPGGCS